MSEIQPIDLHHTPQWLAAQMVSLVQTRRPEAIVDAAAGSGVLLEEALRRFGTVSPTVLATDSAQETVEDLRRSHSNWVVASVDWFDAEAAADWRKSVARLLKPSTVALLNPPFSYRGGTYREIELEGSPLRPTPAVTFAARVVDLLPAGSELVALLPGNAVNTVRDRAIWAHWNERYVVNVISTHARGTFKSASTNSILVSLVKKVPVAGSATLRRPEPAVAAEPDRVPLELIRGRVPVHLQRMKTATLGLFVHTTNLRFNRLTSKPTAVDASKATAGPLLLLPRVGKPDKRKLVLYSGACPAILSDCVYGLRGPEENLSHLHDALMSDFSLLENAYTGSCAPYLTIEALKATLAMLGYDACHVPAST